MTVIQRATPKRGYLKAKRERIRREQEQQQTNKSPSVTLRQQVQIDQQQGTSTSAAAFAAGEPCDDTADSVFAYEGLHPCTKPRKTSLQQQLHACILETKAQSREQKERHEEIERDILRQLAIEKQSREKVEAKLQEALHRQQEQVEQRKQQQQLAVQLKDLQVTVDSLKASLIRVEREAEESKRQALALQQEQHDAVVTDLHQQIASYEKTVQKLKQQRQEQQQEQQKKIWKQREEELVAAHGQEVQQQISLLRSPAEHKPQAAVAESEQQLHQLSMETLHRDYEQRVEELQTELQDKRSKRLQYHDKRVLQLESSRRRIRQKLAQRIQLQHALEKEIKSSRRQLRKHERIETQLRGQTLALQDENAKLKAQLLSGDKDAEGRADTQSAPTTSAEILSLVFNQSKIPHLSPRNKRTIDSKEGDDTSSKAVKRRRTVDMPSYIGASLLRLSQEGCTCCKDDNDASQKACMRRDDV